MQWVKNEDLNQHNNPFVIQGYIWAWMISNLFSFWQDDILSTHKRSPLVRRSKHTIVLSRLIERDHEGRISGTRKGVGVPPFLIKRVSTRVKMIEHHYNLFKWILVPEERKGLKFTTHFVHSWTRGKSTRKVFIIAYIYVFHFGLQHNHLWRLFWWTLWLSYCLQITFL